MEWTLTLEAWQWIAIFTWSAVFAFVGGMATVVVTNKRVYEKTQVCSCASSNC